jgi:hypothetical protein
MTPNKPKKDDTSGQNRLLGWPGYRTRPGRSGWDPIETDNEAAHMEGTFIRNIFTLQARTRNPFYLFLMFVFGVIPLALLVALLIGGISSLSLSSFSLAPLLYFIAFILVTGAVTINFLLSVLEIFGVIASRKHNGHPGRKEYKK